MTNHPRSPRAKFKKGQVVATIYGERPGKVLSVDDGDSSGEFIYCLQEMGWFPQEDLRPLTKKEAGR